jgi:hypothetical protein
MFSVFKSTEFQKLKRLAFFLKSYYYPVNFFSVNSGHNGSDKNFFIWVISAKISGTYVKYCTKNSECSCARVSLIPGG